MHQHGANPMRIGVELSLNHVRYCSEFGIDIPASQSLRVWDSTAEIRYLVLPMQPKESIGLPASDLAKWVTRNSMIGTGLARRPKDD